MTNRKGLKYLKGGANPLPIHSAFQFLSDSSYSSVSKSPSKRPLGSHSTARERPSGFPVTQARKNTWKKILKIEPDVKLPKRPEVCSNHFKENDFTQRANGSKILRRDAVPYLTIGDTKSSSPESDLELTSRKKKEMDSKLVLEVEQESNDFIDEQDIKIEEHSLTDETGESEMYYNENDNQLKNDVCLVKQELYTGDLKQTYIKLENTINDAKDKLVPPTCKEQSRKVVEVKQESNDVSVDEQKIKIKEYSLTDKTRESELYFNEIDNPLKNDVCSLKQELYTGKVIEVKQESNDFIDEQEIKIEEHFLPSTTTGHEMYFNENPQNAKNELFLIKQENDVEVYPG